MNKSEFLLQLDQKLGTLSQSEKEKSLLYYSEAIDDRIEDGMSEEEAVAAIGDIDGIIKEILLETPLPALMKAKIKSGNRFKAWEIVLLVLGSPVWFSLMIAFFAVIFSVYVSVWAVIVSLFASVAAFIIAGIAGLAGSFVFFANSFSSGLFYLGCSFCSIGIGILAFFAVRQLSVWLVKLTALFLRFIKSLFINKQGKDVI